MIRNLILSMLLWPFVGNAQIVTTYAGGGSSGLGDGGIATSAQIHNPRGGVFDKYGNYFIADGSSENRIRKVSNAGIITTIAGNGVGAFAGDNGAATAASLNLPAAVKLDNNGNLYIADFGNNRIRKVNFASGIISTIAGCCDTGGYSGDNAPATAAKLYTTNDLCFDKNGNMYITDVQNYRVRRIDTSGIITTFAGVGIPGYSGDNGQATAAKISLLTGLAIDDTGNLFIAGGNVVRKIDTYGIITTVAGIYGLYSYTVDGVPATNAPINPEKIGIDFDGQLVIADHLNYRIYRVDHEGIIQTIGGCGIPGYSGDNGPASAAEFNYPSGVAFDSCNNLFIPEAGNGRIRKVSFNPYCGPLEVPKIEAKEVKIYPNPCEDNLCIEIGLSGGVYSLFNITGIMEQNGTLQNGRNEIPLKHLPPGVKILEIKGAEPVRVRLLKQ